MDTKGYTIILASGSPRRQSFFEDMEIPFIKKVIPIEENFPKGLSGVEIAKHIALKKAEPFYEKLNLKDIVVTADTIVWHNNKCIGKPKDVYDAEKILTELSGSTHQVITGVGFLQKGSWECVYSISDVTFKSLLIEDIKAYTKTGSPLDKAGAYGIQDSFGTLNITNIKGSYTNIIGLPVPLVYEKIKEIINKSKTI